MDLFRLIAVSLVVMALSHTVARERICDPFRRWCGSRDTWLGYLVSCPYCVSHWIALVLVPVCGAFYLRPPYPWGAAATVIDWLLSSVLVAAIAAFLRVGFYLVDEHQSLARREEEQLADGGAPPVRIGRRGPARAQRNRDRAP